MDKKACDIIALLEKLRLFVQVLSIEGKRHRRRSYAQKSRESSFGRERVVASHKVNDGSIPDYLSTKINLKKKK